MIPPPGSFTTTAGGITNTCDWTLDKDCFDDETDSIYDLEKFTANDKVFDITNAAQDDYFGMGEDSPKMDEYDPYELPYQGMLFDGQQYLRNQPSRNTNPSNQPRYVTLTNRDNFFTVEAWFKLNKDLNPLGMNTGYLFMQHTIGDDGAMVGAHDDHHRERLPVHFAIGVRGEAAVAIIED
jgi:hypothetical protein